MDRINPLAIPLHPVTKTWVCGIVALAAVTSMDLVSPTKFIFFPSRIFVEPWRLLTSFCFFGTLNFSLIQYLLIIARTNNSLEDKYYYKIEYMPHEWVYRLDNESKVALREEIAKRKTGDFAYFIARIALSIVVTILVLSRWYDISGNFFLLGPALEKILLYILCRNTPAEYLQIMGINIMAKYAPFLTQFLEFLFSHEFRRLSLMLHHDAYQAVGEFLTSNLVRQTLLVFTIGHLWWYIQFFYLADVHDEFSSGNSEEWTRAYMSFKKDHYSWLELPDVYRHLITPPWYYLITRNLLKKQIGRYQAREQEMGSGTQDAAPGTPLEPSGSRESGEHINAGQGSSGVEVNDNDLQSRE